VSIPTGEGNYIGKPPSTPQLTIASPISRRKRVEELLGVQDEANWEQLDTSWLSVALLCNETEGTQQVGMALFT